ncbi:MAG: ribonuclease Z [Desulfatitalea sp.]|nr:ribonuclease Z [Desulfatitalea sp.]NNK00768.1 ribonuclease Z [Desulfatitalea sp.]
MRPSFIARLVNSPYGDPGALVSFAFRKHAILFDLGDLSTLAPAELLKIGQAFVTHTHVDHFIGFDHLLRVLLGRDKRLELYGPPGFLSNLKGKLAAYTWNLVQNYTAALVIEASEIDDCRQTRQIFDCRTGFAPSVPQKDDIEDHIIHREPTYDVRAVALDHRTPCLAFSLQERFHVNILKTGLDQMGLPVGPWLARFKELLYRQADPATEVLVPGVRPGEKKRHFTLDALRHRIARTTRGQKIAYVADAVYSADNAERIITLARQADHLFIEAAFLHNEQDVARAKYHLTAHQAGQLARRADVAQMTLFHFSPRHAGQAHLLEAEARRAFQYPL